MDRESLDMIKRLRNFLLNLRDALLNALFINWTLAALCYIKGVFAVHYQCHFIHIFTYSLLLIYFYFVYDKFSNVRVFNSSK